MTCDRCVELEARIEALLDELHDVKVALADVRAVREAVARQRHPSGRIIDDPPEEVAIMRKDMMEELRLRFDDDRCPPNGIRRPVLHLIGGGE